MEPEELRENIVIGFEFMAALATAGLSDNGDLRQEAKEIARRIRNLPPCSQFISDNIAAFAESMSDDYIVGVLRAYNAGVLNAGYVAEKDAVPEAPCESEG